MQASRQFLSRVLAILPVLPLMCMYAPAQDAARGGPADELPPESAEQAAQRLNWWREARFGMFIHWGPVSLKGTEIGWSRGGERRGIGGTGEIPVEVYDNLYKEFNPTKFNAKEWVAIAQAAGMKYLVFTSKHHDGFCEFDSKLTDYKVTNSPFKRDVVKELSDACHAAGLPLGFYYSPPDFHHPDFRSANHQRYVEYLHGQIRELCTHYGKVDIIWFDGLDGTAEEWDSKNLFKLIRRLQPQTVINNRAGLPADHDTPEQEIGRFQFDRPWESCITIGTQWAWKPNDPIKSLKECLHTLIKCAGGDGNLLFNVGPMPTGEIEPRQVERLKEMGRWLAQYGESLYGTRGGPYLPARWGVSTRKVATIYLHVLDWPESETLTLGPIERKVTTATLLAGGPVQFKQDDQGITLHVPRASRQDIDTIVALTLDGPALEIAPRPAAPSHSLAYGKKVTVSNVFQSQQCYAASAAVDDDETTRWATDAGTHQAWLMVDLGQPARIGCVRIVQEPAYADRIRRFELQYQDGGQWKTFLRGTTLSAEYTRDSEPVTAQVIRLNILEASEGPTINELQVFPAK